MWALALFWKSCVSSRWLSAWHLLRSVFFSAWRQHPIGPPYVFLLSFVLKPPALSAFGQAYLWTLWPKKAQIPCFIVILCFLLFYASSDGFQMLFQQKYTESILGFFCLSLVRWVWQLVSADFLLYNRPTNKLKHIITNGTLQSKEKPKISWAECKWLLTHITKWFKDKKK